MKLLLVWGALMAVVSVVVAPPAIVNEPVKITLVKNQVWSHAVLVTVGGGPVTATLEDAPGGIAKPTWLTAAEPSFSGTTAQVNLSGTPISTGLVRFRLKVLAGTTGSTSQDFTLIVQNN